MGFDGSDRNHAFVGAPVTHDANGLDGEQDSEDLAGLAIEAGGDDLFEQDFVGVADDFELLFGDIAQDPHSQTGPREWVTPDDGIGEPEDRAQGADFVFEEFTQRLDEIEPELFGEAADIVVEFDVGRVAAVPVPGFDDIWIERALGEEVSAVDFVGSLFEDFNKPMPNAFALDLWVIDAGKVIEEGFGRIDDAEVDFEMVAEGVFDEIALFVAEQAVVDEDAGELVADGFVEERSDDGGIDAAGEAAEDAFVADEFSYAGDFFVGVGTHFPRA